jgi:O-acetyl-ADP-ribose deacetylase (regulator of RNase III)
VLPLLADAGLAPRRPHVAFPAISTGAFGFPVERAAGIAVRTVADYLEQDAAISRVLLVCRGERALEAFRRAVAAAGG